MLPKPMDVAAISRMFSAGVIQEMARKGRSPLFARLGHESHLFDILATHATVIDVFETAMAVLKRKPNRHEYVYKSALTRNVLLGKHSLSTASMITEFRVEDCKADLVIVNGTSTAYEIKSERDSLTRLERQIGAYRRVCAKVYVIAGENHLHSLLSVLPSDVGVLTLSHRHQISVQRDAVDQPDRTNAAAIFDSIRVDEARKILQLNGIETPRVPNTQISSVLRARFAELAPATAHAGMVKVLQSTRSLKPLSHLIGQLPESLHSVALSVPIRTADQPRLVDAVNTSVSTARTWA